MRASHTLVRSLSAAALAVLAACASGAPPETDPLASASRAAAPAPRSKDVITAEELAAAGADVNLHDAIKRMRPQFFTARGWIQTRSDAANVVQVYVNGTRQAEGPEALRRFQARDVREVRRLSPSQAVQAYGDDNASGAIVVTLR